MKNIFYAVYNDQNKIVAINKIKKDAENNLSYRKTLPKANGYYISKVEVVPIREKKEADPFGTEIL